jgi:hypothetical protein
MPKFSFLYIVYNQLIIKLNCSECCQKDEIVVIKKRQKSEQAQEQARKIPGAKSASSAGQFRRIRRK